MFRFATLPLLAALTLAACVRTEPGDDATVETDTGSEPVETDTGSEPVETDTGMVHTVDCNEGPAEPFYGAYGESSPTTTRTSTDAGIDALIAAAPGDGEDPVEVDLTISGALVTHVAYAGANTPNNYNLIDANDAVNVFGVELDVSLGDTVSMKVTELTNYFGMIEITAAEELSVDSSDNGVYIVDATTAAVAYASEGLLNVRVHGQITSDDEPCGSNNKCYDYLASNGQAFILRVPNNLNGYGNGDCVAVTNPLGQFGGDLQLDVRDFDNITKY